jgi:hypothetical protein
MSARFNIEPVLEWFGAVIPPRSSKLKCPFHDDNHDSGYIPESRQYFKCLACGVQGDAVRLLYTYTVDDFGFVSEISEEERDWRGAFARAKELAGAPEEETSTTPLKSRMRGSTRTLRGHNRFGSGSTGTS